MLATNGQIYKRTQLIIETAPRCLKFLAIWKTCSSKFPDTISLLHPNGNWFIWRARYAQIEDLRSFYRIESGLPCPLPVLPLRVTKARHLSGVPILEKSFILSSPYCGAQQQRRIQGIKEFEEKHSGEKEIKREGMVELWEKEGYIGKNVAYFPSSENYYQLGSMGGCSNSPPPPLPNLAQNRLVRGSWNQ